MGLLRPLGNEIAFAKVGLQGFAGSGKTYTASLIACGLHKYIKSEKPVAFLDTETGSDFVAPVFQAAGIQLIGAKTQSFVDLLAFMKEIRGQADIAIIDSVTHVWRELCSSYQRKLNVSKLEFNHWGRIKDEWRGKFTTDFVNAPMHIIICGRAAYEYDMEMREDGKKELLKTGVKMSAEGDFGYEPSLALQMERVDIDPKLASGLKRKSGNGQRVVLNRAFVLKERFDVIDGHTFDNPTFESFLPHFEKLNIGGQHRAIDASRSSEEMFDSDGNGNWSRERDARRRWVEETAGLLEQLWPGTGKDEKQNKGKALMEFFGTFSWTAIGQMPSDRIKAHYLELARKYNLAPAETPSEPLPETIDTPKEEPCQTESA